MRRHIPTPIRVRAQYDLLTKNLGITHLRAVTGWSMGAGQTYQWATQHPEFMDVAVPFCGSARTSLHNQVFLEGVKSALLAAQQRPSAGVGQGRVEATGNEVRSWTREERSVGLKAFGRGYAGWGFSQAFYRHKLHEKFYAATDLEDFMVNFWEAWALSKGGCGGPDRMMLAKTCMDSSNLTLTTPTDQCQIPRIYSSCCRSGRREIVPSRNRTTATSKRPCAPSKRRPWCCRARQTCISRKV